MKIINKDPTFKKFGDIQPGTVFQSQGSTRVCMRIVTSGNANSVYLDDGTIDYFLPSQVVKVLYCELITWGRERSEDEM